MGAVLVLGAVGIAGAAVVGIFGVVWLAAEADLPARCASPSAS